MISRLEVRFSLSLNVFFLDVLTETVDLSMGGMQIVTDMEIPGDCISIGIQLSDGVFIQLFGEQVWSQHLFNQYISGIKFVDIPMNSRLMLEQYLSN